MAYILDDLQYHFDLNVLVSKEYIAFTIFIALIICNFICLKLDGKQKLINIFLIGYMYIVFSMTVLMRIDKEPQNTARLIPFFTLINYCRFGSTITFWLGMLNILMFVPIGILLDKRKLIYNSGKRYLIICSAIISFSICIEALQYYLRAGVCEFDDVLMNIIGGLLGIFLNIILDKKKHFLIKCLVKG